MTLPLTFTGQGDNSGVACPSHLLEKSEECETSITLKAEQTKHILFSSGTFEKSYMPLKVLVILLMDLVQGNPRTHKYIDNDR